jgi:hypothetical protein
MEILEKRNAVLEELLALSRCQPDLSDDGAPIEDYLAKRQAHVDEVVAISRSLPDPLPPQAAALQERGIELHLQIIQQDKENEAAMKDVIERLREQIKKVKDGKTAFKGYEGPLPDAGATYFDKKR